jgi:putative SOS response-associated peptidase YedK
VSPGGRRNVHITSWQKRAGGKQPYFIRLKDDRPFAFAGLWEQWKRGDDGFESCAVITTGPNELMQPIHDRMPVILRREDYELWLDPSVSDAGELSALLRPYPAGEMVAYPVSTLVNAPVNDRPECVVPLA